MKTKRNVFLLVMVNTTTFKVLQKFNRAKQIRTRFRAHGIVSRKVLSLLSSIK
jgi:hypothetical protein